MNDTISEADVTDKQYLPTFDEWYAALHAGHTFDQDHAWPKHTLIEMMHELTRYMRDYITDMARISGE